MELVLSEYMRGLFEKKGFALSDFETATIIWNREDLGILERKKALLEIAETTTDETLKSQIAQRFSYIHDCLLKMAENENGNYVYVVSALDENDSDDDSCGYFSDLSMAHEYGKNYKYNKYGYTIKKQRIVKESSDLTVRALGRLNWNLIPKEEIEETEEYDGYEVSGAKYDKNGDLLSVWSNEMLKEREDEVDPFRQDRFEQKFFQIPFEGYEGMPVQVTTNCLFGDKGECGILLQTTEGWKDYMERMNGMKNCVDFFDVQVEVVFLTEEGLWTHEHINPIYLEKKMPEFDNPLGKKEKAYMRAFKSFQKYLEKYAEKASDLDMYSEKALQAARKYRDVCLQLKMEQEKQDNDRCDKAKTVEDIII